MISKREYLFNRLWDTLVDKGATITNNTLIFDNDEEHVELKIPGQHYELEVFIANAEGYTTVDIEVIRIDIEDHTWCWKHLNRIGITKDDLNIS